MNAILLPTEADTEDEVSSLIATLLETERRLDELTGGQVDTVSTGSGQPYLLRRAQAELRNGEAAKQAAILNALPAQIALLDALGCIVSVNETWRQSAIANFLQDPAFGVGLNYVAICDQVQGDDSAEAHRVADGIRAVLAGAQTFSLEYACHSPTERRWFQLMVTPLEANGSRGAVVMHVDTSERKRAEAAFDDLSLTTARRERILTTTLSSLNDFAYIYDRAGRFLFANQALLDLWGLTLEEVVGKDFFALGYPDDLARRLQRQVGEVLETKKSLTDETPYTSPGGKSGFYEYIFSPAFGADGDVEFVVGSTRDITERKLAELKIASANRTLQKQSSELQVLFDFTPAMIWFKDTANGYLRVNQRVLEGTGLRADEIEGKSAYEVFPNEAKGYFADDLDVIRSGAPKLGIVERRPGPEGQERWVQTDKVPVCDGEGKVTGLILMEHDITERKRADDALRASEQRFKALFDQAAVGVAQADARTGRYLQVNRRYCEITGRSQEELAELTAVAITHPEYIDRDKEMVRQMIAGDLREFTVEKRYLRKDGSDVWVQVTVSSMWAPGDPPDYFIAVAQDVTGKKLLQEQFYQAQKMDAIGTMAGGIAHDFNNVLTAINGYTELSRMRLKDNPQVRDFLGSVLQASGRAAALVRQILTFSRHQQPERLHISLMPVVEETLKLLRASIPSTIEFEIALAPDTPDVLADSTQIHQILMNLGTNAWHAMKDRPGRLQVTLDTQVVDKAYADTQVQLQPGIYARISVSDTGSGMDEATLRRIFEPFFTTKPVGQGTGLGLAVVHGIMANHDGAVTVYSQPRQGTVFHLYFPAHAGEAIAVAADEGPTPRGNGEQVLFVDDEELLIRLGRNTLTGLGYMVASELSRVRPKLPIILMTGLGVALKSEQVKAAGIFQLLIKPTSIHLLGTAVHAALSAQSTVHSVG